MNREKGDPAPQRIALLIPSLTGGGAERMMINLAGALGEFGHAVDLVLARARGPLLSEVPATVRLVLLGETGGRPHDALPSRANSLQFESPSKIATLPSLLRVPTHLLQLLPLLAIRNGGKILRTIPPLVEYLRAERPDALLAALLPANVAAVVARQLAGVPTRIVVSERNHLSRVVAQTHKPLLRRAPALARHFYPLADALVSVSDGVGDDLAEIIAQPREKIVTVKNPVVTPGLRLRSKQAIHHPWFEAGQPPVLLAVGNLGEQKDFATLIRAVSELRSSRDVRLVILGKGRLREALVELSRKLGIADAVDLHGFVANPYAFMTRAAALVLSSEWEGSPNVLVEAMACGCPVVATDCPSGPAEILDRGRYGPLVPVGDAGALALAIAGVLDAPAPRELLLERSAEYSAAASAAAYLRVLA